MSKVIFENIKSYLKPSNELMQQTGEKINALNSVQTEKRPRIGKRIAATACLVSIVAVTAFSLLYANQNQNILTGDNPVSPIQSEQTVPGSNLILADLSVTAYAPVKSGQILTANYLTETTATKLTPNIKTQMASYSPLSSTVPGYPIKFEFASKLSSEYEIIISVNQGELIQWDSKTGKTQTKGKRYRLQETETIFWSPLSDQGKAGNTEITITLMSNEKSLEQQILHITENNSFYFIAMDKINLL